MYRHDPVMIQVEVRKHSYVTVYNELVVMALQPNKSFDLDNYY